MSQIQLMALRHSAFYAPFLMTVAGGYLRDEGLEPTYEVAAPGRPIAARLAAGTCHVAQSAVATSFAALERGEPVDIVHFAQINERDGFFLVAREAQPGFTWDRLRGRGVLVDHLFQPLAMFRYALSSHGVDPAGLRIVDAGGPDDMEAAFRAGAGDYVHLQAPASHQLAHDGVGHVVAAVGEAVGPVAFSSLCARREWLATDMARAFMRAYRRGREHAIQSPPGEVAALLQEAGYFGETDRRVLAHAVRAYQYLGCWSPGPEISRASYEHLLDVFLSAGLITARHAYEAAIVPPPD
jgi:NitT/TauT family transport system substrate-binding protein